jgi:hypothetical protein
MIKKFVLKNMVSKTVSFKTEIKSTSFSTTEIEARFKSQEEETF